jgi:hypothetical protein
MCLQRRDKVLERRRIIPLRQLVRDAPFRIVADPLAEPRTGPKLLPLYVDQTIVQPAR